MRYYSTHRPIGIGTYPKPAGNRVIEIHNFDLRQECPEIGHTAYGWIEYKAPLSDGDVDRYELTPEGGTAPDASEAAWANFGKYLYKTLPQLVLLKAAKKFATDSSQEAYLQTLPKKELAELIMALAAE